MSDKVKDLKQFKAEKNGEVTIERLINNLYAYVQYGELESIVFITKDKDGNIDYGLSTMNNVEAVGLLEVGKKKVMEDGFE